MGEGDQLTTKLARSICQSLLFFVAMLAWSLPSHAIQRSFLNNGFETINGSTYNGSLVNYCWVGQSIMTPWLSNDGTAAPNTNCNAAGGPGVSGTGNIIELWLNGFNGVTPRSGRVFAELNANSPSTLHQNVCVLQNEDITWRYSHRARGAGTDVMDFYVGAAATGRVIRTSTTNTGGTAINFCQDGSNVSTVSSCTQATTGTWGDYGGVFKWLGTSGVTSINFQAISAVGGLTQGNFLDEVYFYLKPIVEFSASNSSGLESIAVPAAPLLHVVGTLTSPLTISVSVTGGTAVLGTDYTTPSGTANFNITIPVGVYTDTSTFATGITINNDKIANGDRTIIMKVNPNTAYIVSSSQTCGSSVNNPATYTILDDDANLRIINTSIGGTGSFSYTVPTSNVDTNLVTAGNQNTASITTTAANTPVEYDADSGTAGTQPSVVTSVGTAMTVTQTAQAGWTVSGSCTVTGGSNPTSSPIAINSTTGSVTIPAANVTVGSTTTCSFSETNVLTLTKAFSAGTVGVGQKAALTYTITNPTSGTAKTGLTFTDTLPAGLVIANPPNVVNNCGGTTPTSTANDGFFTAGGAGVNAAAGPSSCTVSVDVTSATPASYVNGAAQITAINGQLSNGVTNQTLNVTQAGLTKSFNPTTIDPGGVSTLTFTLANGAGNPAQSGINFTDTLPANVTVATTPTVTSNCPSGGGFVASPAFVTAVASSGTITVTAAAINNAVSTCQITVNVTSSTPGGPYNNTSANIGSSARITNNVVTSGLTVQSLSLTKSFNTATIIAGQSAKLTYAIQNPAGSAARTGGVLTFTDTFPAGLVIASPANVANNCGGTTPTATAGNGFFTVGSSPGVGGVNAAVGASTCTISVDVTSNTGGTFINGNGRITAISGMTNGVTDQTLNVLKLAVTKSFLTPSVGVNGNSTLQIALQNSSSTAITGAAFTDNYGFGTNLVNATVQNAIVGVGCTGILSGFVNGQSLTLTGAIVPANTTCTYSISVKSPTAGSYLNSTGTISTTNAGSTAAATATLTVVVAGQNVSGRVYADFNTNGSAEPTEDWTGGPTVYVKLATFAAGTCVSPALSVQTITAPTGTYTFTAVSAGSYCLVLSSNNVLSDVAASVPAGWRNSLPSTGIANLTVTALDVLNQNFGLFAGSRLSGRVFKDIGNGGGTANDGVQNGAESGISGVTITTNQAGCPGTICATAVTDGNGDYVMWLPTSVTGALTLTETNLAGRISTGGTVGNTSGIYNRITDTTAFTAVPGTNYSAVNFADVPDNQLFTDGVQSALPGATVLYPHTFIAGTSGAVAFTVARLPSPALSGWSELIYVDANCNGLLDATEALVAASVAVTAGQSLCLLVKEFVPPAASVNAQDALTLTASFSSTFSGAPVSFSYLRHDTTTVGQPTGSGLVLWKSVSTASALPGSNITYTVAYTNNSSGQLSNVNINDTTPAYTVFQSASCGALPLNLSLCTITAPGVGSAGAIVYSMTGTLAPGGTGSVFFTVMVDP